MYCRLVRRVVSSPKSNFAVLSVPQVHDWPDYLLSEEYEVIVVSPQTPERRCHTMPLQVDVRTVSDDGFIVGNFRLRFSKKDSYCVIELKREAGGSRPPLTYGVFDEKERRSLQKEPFVQFNTLAEAELWRGISACDVAQVESALGELCSNDKFDINAQMGIGMLRFASPLFHAVCVCEDDDFSIIKVLERSGARWVNARDQTPLENCVEMNKPKFLQAALCALLEHCEDYDSYHEFTHVRIVKKSSGTSKETLSDSASRILTRIADEATKPSAEFVFDLLLDVAAVAPTYADENQLSRVHDADESLREFFAAKSGVDAETVRLTLGAALVESEHTRHMTASLLLAELRRVVAIPAKDS
ncbi:MAG: hypothetical protein MHM6MM_002825 [Cercozoa sp. M6MM]